MYLSSSMLRQYFSAKAPDFFLRMYRVVRGLYRSLTFDLSNEYHATKYRNMVVERFPDLMLVGNSGRVIDLGANIGHFTHACRKMGFEVIAVEPHPQALQKLYRRFGHDEGVQIIAAAIGSENGISLLHLHNDHKKDPIQTSISASTISDKFETTNTAVEVETVTLEQILASAQSVAILKVDIEGAEFEIIPQIIQSEEHIDRLLLETHMRFMKNSVHHSNYSERITNLENFIFCKKLEIKWLTNWI